MKMVMPDSSCRQVDVESGRYMRGMPLVDRYTTGKNGTFEASNPTHIRKLRQLGAFPANVGGTPVGVGYRCSCGHGSFFAVCGRCGATCTREGSNDA